MKFRLFITIILFICITLGSVIYAQQHSRRPVPAIPHPIEHIQPNGDTLMFRLHGDEHRHRTTTLDGYLISKNSRGKMCYAQFNKRGQIKATCHTAHNAEQRSRCEQKYVERHIPNAQKLGQQ